MLFLGYVFSLSLKWLWMTYCNDDGKINPRIRETYDSKGAKIKNGFLLLKMRLSK